MSDTVIYNYYSQQLGADRIEEFINLQKKYQYLGYIILPICYSIKFFLISMCLMVGAIFSNFKISFSKIFKIVIISETIFLIPLIIKIIWFSFFKTRYTLLDLQLFSPFSLLSLVDIANVKKWFYYPLSTTNIFEIIYCFSLSYCLSNQLGLPIKKTGVTVISSYGAGLLVWTIFIMFLSINLS
ncbi:hypothetical protein [Mucilaginibacter ginsenosidivorax]|uniref:Yip1 domain-containing protein n=1 Tax=Mucilaginibacter ginsenosidivorax TaxID=862126 RepID=A0A5B8VX60_9SPHI|nr:hypothetical protein [Mucilaginibacter ginsenosidivorax]QEC76157.1 hypothetical protein FSB76_09455 [Mucilaginibacter ginsenosidivorax]